MATMSGPLSAPFLTESKRYRVLHQLASGGMGEVELAIRSEGGFRRLYAVKRLRAALRDDESARGMFLDEARLAGLVRHPNVVSVLDVGEDERGPFLVMDFVEGISAATLLRSAIRSGLTLPVQLCLRLMRECALGLHAAHELLSEDGSPLGLVHRDVSPQNILIGFDGIARIADFGIAKAVGRTTRTTTGLLKGKAGYMSPEQLRFEEPDRRSDLFSLAIVLYELLAGRRLYRSENDMATARRILNEPPPDIDDVRGDVPPEVVELLFLCLAKDPTVRPKSAQEVAQRLELAIAGLVAEEGAIDVGDYLLEHFAAQRAEVQALLARARDRESEPEIPIVVAPPVESRPLEVEVTAPRSRAPLWAGLVVGVIALGLAGWFGFDRAEPTPAPAVTPRVPEIASVPEVPAPLPAPVAPPPVSAPESPTTEAREAEPDLPTRARRRRATPTPASDDGLFDWQ